MSNVMHEAHASVARGSGDKAGKGDKKHLALVPLVPPKGVKPKFSGGTNLPYPQCAFRSMAYEGLALLDTRMTNSR